jgi:tripartite-type tricarboxylate transporter receptor subunit TctC
MTITTDSRSFSIALHLALVTLLIAAGMAQGQTFPQKPIRVIVGSAPGGAPDILARTIGQKITDSMGQQVVIDNRAGASGAIGAEMTAKAVADGYTLFLSTTMGFAILPHVKKKLSYDAVKDFASITQLAAASNVLVINPAVPAKTVAELLQLAKSRPGGLNYGSAGSGSPAHLAGEMLNMMAGVRMTHVPYKGAAPALLDTIAGHVQFIITSPISAAPHINSGKLRAIATTGSKRNVTFPDLPTVADTLPGFEITQWWGLSAPARTPKAVIDRLHTEAAKAINMPDVRERIARDGAAAVGGTPREFDTLIAAESRRFGELIRKAGIPAED